MINADRIYVGAKYDLYQITNHGKSPLEDFFKSLTKENKNKIIALLQSTADHGLPSNTEKYKKLHCKEIKLNEFKAHQIRIFCALDGKKIILSNGFLKKSNKTSKAEINRAKSLLKAETTTQKLVY
ncbi:MAG: type II toxin-antitoxin system RelE/ParE family toxin [Proteobacteria bacterium]|nr:type II toxin-antitoxin system RelE/ParE family toxin [Pseudomonadota bacterium]